ncbi:hypothetical protein [Agrococcus sp. DT81.2]|uniref:hypothetical protein n=1 Tax=Agrococcus sp. DT81.2 TaxID=3393414 RepID=UPI003CE5B345
MNAPQWPAAPTWARYVLMEGQQHDDGGPARVYYSDNPDSETPKLYRLDGPIEIDRPSGIVGTTTLMAWDTDDATHFKLGDSEQIRSLAAALFDELLDRSDAR